MKTSNITYRAGRLRRTQFRHFGDVIIDGSVDIKNHLIVVGDLTVNGDLDAHGVFCFGSVRVGGNVKVGLLVAVGGIEVKGNACAITLESGAEVDYTAAVAELPEAACQDVETYLARWRGDAFFDDLQELRQSSYAQVTIGGFLDVCTCDIAYGLQVGNWFDVDTGTVGGPAAVRRLYIEEDLRINGSLSVSDTVEGGELFVGDLDVGGDVDLAELSSEDEVVIGGHLRIGDVKVGGALTVATHLSCYGQVVVNMSLSVGEAIAVKGQIEVGDDFGVLCGLRVPRNEWSQRGWISCPKPPKHLYTGVYIKMKDFDEMSELLLSLESAENS